jgi:5-(carboxyamino)imidazole ribonucleotide synthase
MSGSFSSVVAPPPPLVSVRPVRRADRGGPTFPGALPSGAPRGQTTRATVRPGGVVGVLGGGAAAREIALAARTLGYRVRAFYADPGCGVAPLAEHAVRAPLDDADAAAAALAGCDVVTPSVEQVPPTTLDAVARAGAPVRPGRALLAVAQDRVLERDWLAERGVPLVPWYAVTTLEEAHDARAVLDGAVVLKPARRRGHAAAVRRVDTHAELKAAWAELAGGEGRARCAVEQAVAIDAELSVVVARTPAGVVAAYPAAESRRRDHDGVPRLLWSVLPARGPAAHARKAERLAAWVAERLQVEGLLAVEMFLLADGRLVVNELVPCPHPTFAGAERACATGQYEQLVRAICGLPLGPTALLRPAAVAPVYGDAWGSGEPRDVRAALGESGVTLHEYGVHEMGEASAGRVGHVTALGDTPGDAVRRVLQAHTALGLHRSDCEPPPSGHPPGVCAGGDA